MLKKIISIIAAILIGYIVLRLFGFVFSVVFSMMFFMLKIGVIAVIAIPAYFFVMKLLNKRQH